MKNIQLRPFQVWSWIWCKSRQCKSPDDKILQHKTIKIQSKNNLTSFLRYCFCEFGFLWLWIERSECSGERKREREIELQIFSHHRPKEQRWRDGRRMRNKGREVMTGLSCSVEGWQPRIRVMKEEKEKSYISPPFVIAPCLSVSLCDPFRLPPWV